MRYNQNLFTAGEAGERISALRKTDVYKLSLKKIENFIITSLGNLKIAKQYNKVSRPDITGEIIKVIATKYDFDIVVTTNEIITYEKETYTLLHKYDLSNDKDASVEFIDTTLFTPNKYLDINLSTKALTENTKFISEGLTPLKNKSRITIDWYQVKKLERIIQNPNDTTKTQKENYYLPVLLGTVTEQAFEQKSSGTYLKGTTNKISRFYKNFVGNFVEPVGTATKFKEGEIFVVIHPFLESEKGEFYVDNHKVTFSGKVETSEANPSGVYYTTMNGLSTGDKGEIYYGEMIDISNSKIFAEFHDRMVIEKEGVLYFSRVNDYNNFRNGTEQTDAFYFKPSPIFGEHGKIVKLISGKGLYVITTKGIYVVAYNQQISPSNIPVIIGTDVNASANATLVGDNLYFQKKGKFDEKLFCLQNIATKQLQLDFEAFPVDKFSYNEDYGTLSTVVVANKKYMVANSKENLKNGKQRTKVYLFDSFKLGNFVRTTLYIDEEESVVDRVPGEVVGFLSGFLKSGYTYQVTNKNKKEGKIKLNLPYIETSKGGVFLNDKSSKLNRIVVKFLEEVEGTERAISEVLLNNSRFNQLGLESGLETSYKAELGSQQLENMEIKIISEENDKILEIQGYELFLTERGD